LVVQVQGILTNLVNLSATSTGGRYVFSGDLDHQALYTLDPTQPTGVRQLATATSTRVITDLNGSPIWLGKTASEIFDDRNPDTTPANDNVFAAVNSLLTALQNNDPVASEASIANLKAADDHLNQELGYYGIGASRINDNLTQTTSSLESVQTNISSLRDADMATAAIQLSQLTVQQQAALSARAKVNGLNLFDFLA
jgi:flagellin-like hook-associated protein FlgL